MKEEVKQHISLGEYQVKRAYAVTKNKISFRLDKEAFRTKLRRFTNLKKKTFLKQQLLKWIQNYNKTS